MFDALAKITITCFATSYLVVLGLEVSRLFFRLPVRMAILVGFAAAGLFTHVVYLVNIAQAEFSKGALMISPSSLAITWYSSNNCRQPKSASIYFLAPLLAPS